MNRQYLLYVGPRQVEINQEQLPRLPADRVLVKAHYSAISPGTELLLYRGEMPSGMKTDGNLASLSGDLNYPLRYGYSLVGEVVETGSDVDRSLNGRLVMAFHPHASMLQVSPDDLVWLEDGLELTDAVFLPNLETAVTLTHDGAPLIGEIVAVFGQGVVGLLTTNLLARLNLGTLIALDPVEARRSWSLKMGADQVIDPENLDAMQQLMSSLGLPDMQAGADLCFELSGQPEALNQAIQLTRFSGRIILGSWYGTRPSSLDLGSRFHRSRISITSSQVSTIKPELNARWSKQRRLEYALQLLPQVQPSRLITHKLPLDQARKAFALLDESPDEALAVVFQYQD